MDLENFDTTNGTDNFVSVNKNIFRTGKIEKKTRFEAEKKPSVTTGNNIRLYSDRNIYDD